MGTILIPSVLNSCGNKPLTALNAWNGPIPIEQDIRIILVSYAILAPNPHNKQPWIVEFLSPDRLYLYVDQNRLLPETDPPYRQIHIGQGTFLENLSLAAQNFGYHAKIKYFPQGMYSNTEVENKPVAFIELIKEASIKKDPLFEVILLRQSNKRVYNEQEISNSQLNLLKTAYDTTNYSLNIMTEITQRKKLAILLGKAMSIETENEKRHAETVAMFRFNNEELETYRDGFGVANAGITGLKKFIAETFFIGSREEALNTTSSFAKASVDLTKNQADSAMAFGWITSKTNTRLDQIIIGRAYERVNLLATKLGIALHPMSQILQEYSDMAPLQEEFLQFLNVPHGHTVQMLFRLGYADPVAHSPRRSITTMIKI
ncbi:twin-arginine translocation pathway signal protein [Deltaproteobacteria bacterium TL4]